MWKWMISGVLLLGVQAALAEDLTAADIIRKAVDNFRGRTSYSELTMIIHRPDWQRELAMRAWTEGDRQVLVRVTEPSKDAGNGSLAVDGNMWTYTPKSNRVIKLSPDMMSQNWMGSDFSNRDLNQTSSLVDQYDHTLLALRQNNGHQSYVIESIPQEGAEVVWGREVLHIRDDWVILEQQFWDRDDVLVKTLQTLEIAEMSGRNVAAVMRMERVDAPGKWTELRTGAVQFDVEHPGNLFTLSNLRKPGE